jgi:hypothetical protein
MIDITDRMIADHRSPNRPFTHYYLPSLWGVCLRQKRQNFENSSRSVVFFLFFDVL